MNYSPSAGRTRSLFALERRYAIGLACLFSLLVMLGLAGRASALNYVYDTNQDFWAVNDAAIPGLDTGSIQSTATHSLQGYGGIRMQVDGAAELNDFGQRTTGGARSTSASRPSTRSGATSSHRGWPSATSPRPPSRAS